MGSVGRRNRVSRSIFVGDGDVGRNPVSRGIGGGRNRVSRSIFVGDGDGGRNPVSRWDGAQRLAPTSVNSEGNLESVGATLQGCPTGVRMRV